MALKQLFSTDLNLNRVNEIEGARKVVEMVMGVDILAKNRKRYTVESRMIFASLLRDMDYSLKDIGKVLRKDHTTIIHYLRKLKDLTDIDMALLKKHLKCRELMALKEQPVNLLDEADLAAEVRRLREVVDILEKEKQILVKEKQKLIDELSVNTDNRFTKILNYLKENTPIGNELIIERKIRKMFDD